MRQKFAVLFCAALLLGASPRHAWSQVAPYDPQLNDLAQVLGSLHYLRNLCAQPTNDWRDQMSQLLAVEAPSPQRRAHLIASFNRGYRSFGSVYTVCTDQARISADRFLERGAALAALIESRFAE